MSLHSHLARSIKFQNNRRSPVKSTDSKDQDSEDPNYTLLKGSPYDLKLSRSSNPNFSSLVNKLSKMDNNSYLKLTQNGQNNRFQASSVQLDSDRTTRSNNSRISKLSSHFTSQASSKFNFGQKVNLTDILNNYDQAMDEAQ